MAETGAICQALDALGELEVVEAVEAAFWVECFRSLKKPLMSCAKHRCFTIEQCAVQALDLI